MPLEKTMECFRQAGRSSGLPACIYNHIAFEETSFWFPIEEQGKGRFPVKEEPAFLFWLFLFLMYSLSVFRWCPVKDTIDDDVPVQHDRKENGAGYRGFQPCYGSRAFGQRKDQCTNIHACKQKSADGRQNAF